MSYSPIASHQKPTFQSFWIKSLLTWCSFNPLFWGKSPPPGKDQLINCQSCMPSPKLKVFPVKSFCHKRTFLSRNVYTSHTLKCPKGCSSKNFQPCSKISSVQLSIFFFHVLIPLPSCRSHIILPFSIPCGKLFLFSYVASLDKTLKLSGLCSLQQSYYFSLCSIWMKALN